MFERYTKKARRSIFFARYKACKFGSPTIETEHLLVGLLHENKALSARLFQPPTTPESLHEQICLSRPFQERISTSVDPKLSNESRRVLAYAAEEADKLKHRFIGTEHLLLGLLRDKQSFAAELLSQHGGIDSAVRKDIQDGQSSES